MAGLSGRSCEAALDWLMLWVCDSLGSSRDCWAWSSMMLKSVWGVILLLLCESASKRAGR